MVSEDNTVEQLQLQRQRVTELELKLSQEQERSKQLTTTVNNLKQQIASLLATCEQSQEGVSNRLIREITRLRNLQLEMCNEFELGEAKLVSVLEDRLRTLQHEKVEIERAAEEEQERIVNKLQRQMDELKIQGSFSVSPRSVDMRSDGILAAHMEKEAELQRQITKLQEEYQQVVVENLRLRGRLRRQSIEDSPLLEPLSPTIPLRKSESTSSSVMGIPLIGSSKSKSGSIAELHLASTKKGKENIIGSDSESASNSGSFA